MYVFIQINPNDLKADTWPYGQPMSAAELIQYIANHVA
jgi:hypothetical protein